MNAYIVRDSSGWALQFTESGKSVQCSTCEADKFSTPEQAKLASVRAEEHGAEIETLTFDYEEFIGATDGDGVENMLDHS